MSGIYYAALCGIKHRRPFKLIKLILEDSCDQYYYRTSYR